MNPLLTRRHWMAQAGLLCALALGSCATYQPPSLPEKQLTTIGIDAQDRGALALAASVKDEILNTTPAIERIDTASRNV
jgi:hypothetical protein